MNYFNSFQKDTDKYSRIDEVDGVNRRITDEARGMMSRERNYETVHFQRVQINHFKRRFKSAVWGWQNGPGILDRSRALDQIDLALYNRPQAKGEKVLSN